MRSQINFSSGQAVHISTKPSNHPTSFIHNATHIMQDISLVGAPSTQQLTSSMESSYTGEPRINPRHPESVPIEPVKLYVGLVY